MLLVCLIAQPALADVAVLANRTVSAVTVEILSGGGLPESLTIPAGDSQPVFFQSTLQVRFGTGLQARQFPLQSGNAYFFTRLNNGETLHLEQIGLGEQEKPAPELTQKPMTLQDGTKIPSQPAIITVKLLVDDDQPTHRRIWEAKLRRRIAEASEILERHSGVRLQVIEVATWETNDKQHDFRLTLREFEREVKPGPAQLAIGFSSQYQATRGRTHLGVTRWPLHTHILLRERSRNLLEVERLELLVHELGHYLGASHSPEPQSVMRPLLTRGQQRTVGTRIQFDPVNALLIALTAEEVRQRGVRRVNQLSQPTVTRMKQIYGILRQAMPQDPAARQQLTVLNRMTTPQRRVAPTQPTRSAPLMRETQAVLSHLVKVALQQQQATETLSGDELTNLYVRQAAAAASRLRSVNTGRVFLLAMGVFIDNTSSLRSLPSVGDFVSRVESEMQRSERTQAMGKPTMRERDDLTKHFFVSAHLVVAIGKQATANAGLAKEMVDARGGTGFSFIDLAANQAGIVFAEHVLSGELPLAEVARGFHVDDYLPTLVGLEEGLTMAALEEQFGGADQSTVAQELAAIKQRVLKLPMYDRAE